MAERVMSEAEKAKRSATAKAKRIPYRIADQRLLQYMVEGARKDLNSMSHDEQRIVYEQMAKLQVKMSLGPMGYVDITKRDKSGTERVFKTLSWTKLGIDDQADIIKALKAGKAITFATDPETGDLVEQVEADEEERQAA